MKSPARISFRQSNRFSRTRVPMSLYFKVSVECVDPAGCPNVAVEAVGETDVKAAVFTEPVPIMAWREKTVFYGVFEVSGRKTRRAKRLDVGVVRVSVGDRRIWGRRVRVEISDDVEPLRTEDLDLDLEAMRAGGRLGDS